MNTIYRFVLALMIVSTSCFSWAQENDFEAVLKHELRKATSDSIILAGDEMKPKSYLIVLPDSIYTSSKITINKFNIRNVSKSNVIIRSSSHLIYNVSYQIKGNKNAKAFLQLLLERLEIDEAKLGAGKILWNGKNVIFSYDISKRYHYFTFYIEQAK